MQVLIEEYKIDRRIRALAHKITEDHRNSGNNAPPVMICVLNGAFMFFTDLVKDMGIDCEIDFIQAKSYVGEYQTEIKLTKDLTTNIQGKDVYLIDDILDSGKTLKFLIHHLEHKHKPSSITPVVLLKRYSNVWPIIHGIEIKDDTFVFGYGLDGEGGLGRNRVGIFGKSED